MNTEAASIQMKVSKTSITVWLVLLSLPLAVCSLLTMKHPSWWFAVVVCLVSVVFILLWLKSYKVGVSNGTMTISSLLTKSRCVFLEDIADARFVAVGFPGCKHHSKPPIRLEITFKNGITKPLIINLKVFDKQDINSLMVLFGCE